MMTFGEVERYVQQYGERFRRLIVEALKCLDSRTFVVDEPFDVDAYIADLIERAAK